VSYGVLESNTAQIGPVGVLESSGVLSGAEDSPRPVFEGVSDLGQIGTGPSLVFVDSLHGPFINLDWVGDIEKNDSDKSNTPIEIVQSKPIQVPTPSVRRQFKTPAGRTDLPSVRKFRALHSRSSSARPQPGATPLTTSTKPTAKSSANPTAKSSIKSGYKASQKPPETPKPAEQEAKQVAETVPSPAPLTAKDKEKTDS